MFLYPYVSKYETDYNNPRFYTIRAYFYKSKLIKVIVTNKETKKKNNRK